MILIHLKDISLNAKIYTLANKNHKVVSISLFLNNSILNNRPTAKLSNYPKQLLMQIGGKNSKA